MPSPEGFTSLKANPMKERNFSKQNCPLAK
jgi:hypothetical protein